MYAYPTLLHLSPTVPYSHPSRSPQSILFKKHLRGGMGWEGLRGGHVYLQLTHFDVWQTPMQYCESIFLQVSLYKTRFGKKFIFNALSIYCWSKGWAEVCGLKQRPRGRSDLRCSLKAELIWSVQAWSYNQFPSVSSSWFVYRNNLKTVLQSIQGVICFSSSLLFLMEGKDTTCLLFKYAKAVSTFYKTVINSRVNSSAENPPRAPTCPRHHFSIYLDKVHGFRINYG